MLQVKIFLLSELDSKDISAMSKQIASWHYSQWGRYHANSTEKDWLAHMECSLQSEDEAIIVALAENQLIGSVSLKKDNMDNTFPDYTPWLSGLYIKDTFRGKKIGAILIKELFELAFKKGYKEVYIFTHNLKLENFYKKFGCEIVTPQNAEYFYYKNEPILLFKNNICSNLSVIEKYLNKSGIYPSHLKMQYWLSTTGCHPRRS